MGRFDTDRRTAALVMEVERRRKLPGLHNYSYGRLIADTTREQRDRLEEQYRPERRAMGVFTAPEGDLEPEWQTKRRRKKAPQGKLYKKCQLCGAMFQVPDRKRRKYCGEGCRCRAAAAARKIKGKKHT